VGSVPRDASARFTTDALLPGALIRFAARLHFVE
jgi:hypothetical protein